MSESARLTFVFELLHCASCGIPFMLSSDYLQNRRHLGKSFCCPNGHGLNYPANTKEQELRLELAELEGDLEESQSALKTIKQALKLASARIQQLEREQRKPAKVPALAEQKESGKLEHENEGEKSIPDPLTHAPKVRRRDLATKPCEVCGEGFGPNDRERPNHYLKRRTCSHKCSSELRSREAKEAFAKAERATPSGQKGVPSTTGRPPGRAEEIPDKPCEWCREPFSIQDNERPVRFAERRFCSQSCAGMAAAAKRRDEKEAKAASEPPLDENSLEYKPETREALRLFHDRYPDMTPHVAWQDFGEDATAYWLECLSQSGAIK